MKHSSFERNDSVRAMPSARAGRATPRAGSRLGHSATIDYRGTLRPTFTCRTLKPPHMRGHRQWLKLEGRG